MIVHCGSGPVATPFTGPAPMARVLAEHPALRLVVAHFGLPEYVEFLDLADRYDGVLFDTTMAFTDFFVQVELPDGQRKRIAEFEDRILFGSDFPNIPYCYDRRAGSLVPPRFRRRLAPRRVPWERGADLRGLKGACRGRGQPRGGGRSRPRGGGSGRGRSSGPATRS